eukprot:gene16826-biopygen785
MTAWEAVTGGYFAACCFASPEPAMAGALEEIWAGLEPKNSHDDAGRASDRMRGSRGRLSDLRWTMLALPRTQASRLPPQADLGGSPRTPATFGLDQSEE